MLSTSANAAALITEACDFSSTPNYSEKIAAEIDSEINSIITTQYTKAVEILKKDIDKLHLIAKELFENEKISGEDFKKLMENDETLLSQHESAAEIEENN